MATPVGQFRPWRLVMSFIVITLGLYSLVFFTAGSNTPKLGIDLQGGTRITLTAKTADNAVPSRNSMVLARDIMERRVNGSGVAGAQVQIDGASQLIVTVPGTQDLANLTRSAQLNLRPVLTSVRPTSAGIGPVVSGTTDTSATGTAATGSGVAGTGSATGSTESVPAQSAPAAATTTGATAAATASAPTSQGLRAPNLAVARETTPAGTDPASTDPATAVATPIVATPIAATPIAATTGSDTTGTDTTATGTDTTATGTGAATGPVAFPATSDPKNPSQPASATAADWTAWQSEAFAAMQAGLTCAQLAPYEGQDDIVKPLLACDDAGTNMYLLDATLIPGSQVDTASALLSQTSGWTVNLKFKSDGFTKWAEYTTNNIGKQVAFTLDGKVLVAPSINSAITTDTEITGNFTQGEAVDLANSLKFGALPLQFERSSSESVTAELGLSYLRAGLIAGGIGLLLVVIYCLIYYRLLGVITILSLVLSFSLIYAVLVLLGRWMGLSLDMSGVAGLIIAIGITADSFVVYFERIKDEVREGRTFRSAVPRGWGRAKRTILSADAVSFLAAAILYILAVGDVKGFAFTLGLSTVLDLVVVFLVTHPLVALASGNKIFASPRWSGLGAVAKAGAQQRESAAQLSVKGS